ncbi:hypothetical protein JWG39_05135 [Desulforhopalus vacuolatus]|uniref:hypothetical protein n=1 Tax=Desulforhopalus vacuolatus TaxID=40414 RepID=UPI0019633568|nr:hypothetical protein [Desulforhopalus vacuolatus]MBM9519203.1 hypothetical protein [Desulforhopalus vacuolatus]
MDNTLNLVLESDMLQAIYLNNSEAKQITIDQIAGYCSLSLNRVRYLISTRRLPGNVEKNSVRLIDFLGFLLHNRMSIPERLLPPRTSRILFLYPAELLLDSGMAKRLRRKMNRICEAIAKSCHLVLADSIPFGVHASLTLLNFMPHIVVFTVLERPGRQLLATMDRVTSLTTSKTVLLLDQNTAAREMLKSSVDLVTDGRPPFENLQQKLALLLNG